MFKLKVYKFKIVNLVIVEVKVGERFSIETNFMV